MSADVICVSRGLAAGGEDVARRVADGLGFRYVDQEILIAAAEKQHLEPEQLASVERRRFGLVRFIDEFVGGGMIEEALRSIIRQEIADTAAAGGVVIVAHGASIALVGTPRLLRILVTGSPDNRAARLAANERLLLDEAKQRVRESDKSRAAYLKHFYGADETPTDYDLVVNTDYLAVDDAADLVLQAARRLKHVSGKA